MRCFICTLDKINLGIPAERTERIIPVARVQTAVHETENQELFISLPALLRQKDAAAPHGVVLKPADGPVKTVLLTPKIDIDMEIPEESIHQLPQALSGLSCFRGAYFNNQGLYLILDPEKLTGGIP